MALTQTYILNGLNLCFLTFIFHFTLFRDCSDGKESACKVGGLSSIPGPGRSPGEGNGSPLQYSCLENSTGRGAWQATASGASKSRTRLSATERTQHTHDLVAESSKEAGNKRRCSQVHKLSPSPTFVFLSSN